MTVSRMGVSQFGSDAQRTPLFGASGSELPLHQLRHHLLSGTRGEMFEPVGRDRACHPPSDIRGAGVCSVGFSLTLILDGWRRASTSMVWSLDVAASSTGRHSSRYGASATRSSTTPLLPAVALVVTAAVISLVVARAVLDLPTDWVVAFALTASSITHDALRPPTHAGSRASGNPAHTGRTDSGLPRRERVTDDAGGGATGPDSRWRGGAEGRSIALAGHR